MRFAIAVVCATACGRIGFAPSGSGTGGDGGNSPDVVVTTRHWQQRANAAQPGKLVSPRMVYDDARGTVIQYGGDDVVSSAAMWELRDTGWVSLCDPCAPGVRFLQGMAYDRARDRIVLFGGEDAAGTPLGDTWEWDGTTWTNVAATTPPSARDRITGVSGAGTVGMVGGIAGGVPVAEIYHWVPPAWVRESTSGGPDHLAAWGSVATYDSARQRLLALGDEGTDSGTVDRDDLWSLDASGWTEVCATCSGTPRNSATIIYDPDLDTTWLFGGFNGTEIAGSWQLQGNAFMPFDLSLPPARDSVGVAYDAKRHTIVIYGGNGNSCAGAGNCAETWELLPN